MDKFVTVKEASEILGLTKGRIRQLLLAGKFEGAEKVGPLSIIPLKSVAALQVEKQMKQLRKTNGKRQAA